MIFLQFSYILGLVTVDLTVQNGAILSFFKISSLVDNHNFETNMSCPVVPMDLVNLNKDDFPFVKKFIL